MAKYQIEAAAYNNKGRVRKNNEDSFYLNGQWMPLEKMDEGGVFHAQSSDSVQLYAVCDGMGGEASGEVASNLAVKGLSRLQSEKATPIDVDTLSRQITKISEKIYTDAQKQNARSGSTLVACLWKDQHMHLLHVGDSRIYRLREGNLQQMTLDHSEVQRMVSMGLISAEEAQTHPKRHVISQYLGMPSNEVRIEPTISPALDVAAGDRYLLCSDGLTDMVADKDIAKLLTAAPSPEKAVVTLGEAALQNGGHDNVTVLCIDVEVKRKSAPPFLQTALLASALLAGIGGLLCLAEFLFRMQ